MSVISGFADPRGTVKDSVAALRAMQAAVAGHAPDDACACHRNHIHLAASDAVGRDETGRIIVVFTGELIRGDDLRASLISRSHHFATNSDAETIAHAYEAFGLDLFKHLHGAFAFALYDEAADRIVLARDRAGEKPFYYTPAGPCIVFSTDLKAMLAHPSVSRDLDPVALQQYLLFNAVVTPRSIFRSIAKLAEGSYVVIERGEVQEPKQYWQYRFLDPPERRSERDWVGLIDETLRESVRRRLGGAVTPGVFLSGGCDSSLVTAMMCSLMPPKQVKTFSIRVDDPAYDESYWSRWAVRLMGTDHHEFTLNADGMIDYVEPVLRTLCEPMADSSLVPSYMVAKLTREHVPVALAGDAGDELFGGYPKYFAQRWAARLQRVPRGLRRWLIEKPLLLIPSRDGSVLFGQNKVAAFFRSVDEHYALRSQFWVSPFQPSQIAELSGRPLAAEVIGPVLRRADEYQGPDDIVSRSQFLDFKLIMLDVFNVKVERATALAGLGVREPFLDTDMIELAASIPSKLKVRGMRTKHILKRVAERYYPYDFVHRKKWGFGIPVKRWIRSSLRPRFSEVLSEENVRRAGLVNPALCHRLLDEHCAETQTHTAALWNLFVLHVWHENITRL